jgi:hypothetical protein
MSCSCKKFPFGRKHIFQPQNYPSWIYKYYFKYKNNWQKYCHLIYACFLVKLVFELAAASCRVECPWHSTLRSLLEAGKKDRRQTTGDGSERLARLAGAEHAQHNHVARAVIAAGVGLHAVHHDITRWLSQDSSRTPG